MHDFSHMTLEELVREQGYDCECGRHHVCSLDFLKIERGAIRYVADMVRAMGKSHPFVVCDDNTYRVAGEKVCALLQEAGIEYDCYVIPAHGEKIAPAEWEVGSVVFHADPACDMVLAVGSGVVNDICKVVARVMKIPSAVVGTAPSMDGFASNSSSMEVNHVKVTLYNQAPRGILLDADILAKAPMRMLRAGLGDIAAKYIAICEWRMAHLVIGEYYCERVADLMRMALKKVMDAAGGIPNRDPDAVKAIAEGLVIAGIAMAYAKVSRPASGLEHYFSHMWEMMALERNVPYDLHGIQVGIGTVLCMKLYEKIRQVQPDREKAEAHMANFDASAWESQVRRIFGKTAGEVLAIEEKAHKNDPVKHAVRLENILSHWEDILQIIEDELPDAQKLYAAFAQTGMPMKPSDIGIPMQDVLDAFVAARDIRDKYMSCSLLWDLGLTEEFTAYLAQVAEK